MSMPFSIYNPWSSAPGKEPYTQEEIEALLKEYGTPEEYEKRQKEWEEEYKKMVEEAERLREQGIDVNYA